METKIGNKIRKIREIKGFSQEYLASKIGISQRAYSKLEANQIKIDWDRITLIAEILDVDPIDMLTFDDNLIFNNCNQSGKFEQFINQIPDKLIEQYEKRIEALEREIYFLKEIIKK
jgi:transcriptional regulator with XRE-family HTH domain